MLVGAFPKYSFPDRAWPDRGWPEYLLVPPTPIISSSCPTINSRLPECFTLYLCAYCPKGMNCLIRIKNEHRW